MNKVIRILCLNALLIGSASLAMDVNQNQGQNPTRDEYNKHPIERAAVKGNLEMVRTLLKGKEVTSEDKTSALKRAASRGYLEICKLLIDSKASLNGAYKSDDTPLNLAASSGHEEVCRLLLGCNALVDIENSNQTALASAAARGHVKICELLLDYKAEVDRKGLMTTMTPLAEAAYTGNHGTIQLLIDRNATLDSKDNRGLTPLIYATLSKNEKAPELFIDIILQPIIQKTDSIITILGCNRKRRANLWCLLPRDVAEMIMRKLYEPIKQEKQKLFAAIDKITNPNTKLNLSTYTRLQLKSNSNTGE